MTVLLPFPSQAVTLLVHKTHPNAFRNVSEAYAAAADGDTLLIYTDSYDEIPSGAGETLAFDAAKIVLFVPTNGPVAIAVATVPANDQFEQRTPLSGLGLTMPGWNLAATRHPDDPRHSCLPAANSVWWSWTAPASGPVEVSVANAPFDPWVAAFTGETLSTLTPVAGTHGSDGAALRYSRLRFHANQGTMYQVLVASLDAGSGNFNLRLNVVPQSWPDNDDFAHRRRLTGVDAEASGRIDGATVEVDELRPDNAANQSIWWTWTAPSNGLVLVTSLASSQFSHYLAAYTGDAVCRLTRVADTFVSLLALGNPLQFFAEAGTDYHLAVNNALAGNIGSVNFHLTLAPYPQNDSFVNATTVTNEWISVTNSNLAATGEPDEFSPFATAARQTVWWAWTAPLSPVTGRPVTISTAGSTFDTLLAVYANGLPGTATLVATNDNETPTNEASLVTFIPTPGVTYFISVDGARRRANVWNYSGDVRLTIDYSALNVADVMQDASCGGVTPCQRISGRLELRHYGEEATHPLRVRLIAANGYRRNLGAGVSNVPPIDLAVLSLPTPGTLQPGSVVAVNYTNVQYPGPDEAKPGSGFAKGWGVFAVLEEQLGIAWLPVDSTRIFYGSWPVVAEFTPNGGVIRSDPPNRAPVGMIDFVFIDLPTTLPERGSAQVRAVCKFDDGSSLPAEPDWLPANPRLPTTTGGVVTAASVLTNTVTRLAARLSFSGSLWTNDAAITIANVLPTVSVVPPILSNGASASFVWIGDPDRTVLETTTNLTKPVQWTAVLTNTSGATGSWPLVPALPLRETQRFFRAREMR